LTKSCAEANIIYFRPESVLSLEHYFASKSFSAVCEAFTKAYLVMEVPNKKTEKRLVTFRICQSAETGCDVSC
jgi:hypothetical protein